MALMSNYSDDFVAATDQTGNNSIALAAVEGHVELLQWLHGQGCAIQSRNCRGRTPLLIASLWGRVPVMDYLLKKGVDAKMRDNKGRSALDLALPNPRNRNERKRKMVLYREPQEADQYRHRIAIRLQSILGVIPPVKYTQVPQCQRNRTGMFLDPGSSFQSSAIHYYSLDQSYPVPNAGKAIGHLDRGPLFPIISAMSGYSHSEWDPCTILDNAKWAAEVMNLGRRLNVPVEQSYASHVEKQLLTFYVSKHVLLDDELDELQQVKPQGPPVEAKIVVSKAESCHKSGVHRAGPWSDINAINGQMYQGTRYRQMVIKSTIVASSIDRLMKSGRQETLCSEMDQILSAFEARHRNLLQYMTRNRFLKYSL